MTAERPDHSEPEPRLDVDAAFAEIVAHWEPSEPDPDAAGQDSASPVADADRAQAKAQDAAAEVEPPPSTGAVQPAPNPEPKPDPDRLRGLFRPGWSDSLDDEASWADEGHFVPPPPPPLPTLDPRRKLAWGALLGTPAMALLLLVLDWGIPRWALVGMVAAFVGGFCYLVATMSSSDHDGWSGGDGAVV